MKKAFKKKLAAKNGVTFTKKLAKRKTALKKPRWKTKVSGDNWRENGGRT